MDSFDTREIIGNNRAWLPRRKLWCSNAGVASKLWNTFDYRDNGERRWPLDGWNLSKRRINCKTVGGADLLHNNNSRGPPGGRSEPWIG
jgi:hypothetical protein